MPMVRERPSLAPRQFIEVTPGIRRALELLAEASIQLLDEIDAPTEDLEEDDPEEDADVDEDGHDAEMEWGDSTLTLTDTSRGYAFAASICFQWNDALAWRESFDPRLARRPAPGCTIPYARRILPTFPHEPADRPPLNLPGELRRLNGLCRSARRGKNT